MIIIIECHLTINFIYQLTTNFWAKYELTTIFWANCQLTVNPISTLYRVMEHARSLESTKEAQDFPEAIAEGNYNIPCFRDSPF